MSEPASPLASLAEQLAGMSQPDREFVLASLSEAECLQVLPLLASARGSRFSPALAKLIGACEAGLPNGLTERAARALLAAARQGEPVAELPPRDSAAVPASLWDRIKRSGLGARRAA